MQTYLLRKVYKYFLSSFMDLKLTIQFFTDLKLDPL